jgi:biopolymer transport protein TolQ
MEQMSIISLIVNASLAVKAVMLLLGLFSVISWAIIFNKWLTLAKVKSATASFYNQYTTTNSLNSLYTLVAQDKQRYTTSQMFYAGLTEYNRLNKNGVHNKDTISNNIERTLTATLDDELNNYEARLSTLATFGSVSPYIGLLGTVWGIMHAFLGLGNTGQATLASVAPGIAEALIATAIGLFVAIPAYIAYNKFTADVSFLEKKMNKFGDEFLNLINRKLAASNQEI